MDQGPATEHDVPRRDARDPVFGGRDEARANELVRFFRGRREIRISGLGVHQRPEHQPEHRRISRGEEHVCDADGVALPPGIPAFAIGRLAELAAERAEPVLGYRGEQRVAVGEVVIRRAVGHASYASCRAQGKPLLPVLLDQSTGRLDERAAQIAVMVVRPLSFQVEGLMPRVNTEANRSTENLENRPSRCTKALGFLSPFAMRKRGRRTFACSPQSRGILT